MKTALRGFAQTSIKIGGHYVRPGETVEIETQDEFNWLLKNGAITEEKTDSIVLSENLLDVIAKFGGNYEPIPAMVSIAKRSNLEIIEQETKRLSEKLKKQIKIISGSRDDTSMFKFSYVVME